MDNDEFLAEVQRRGELGADEAETLTRATLEELAQAITVEQADYMAGQLPEPLREALRDPRGRDAEALSLEEFVQRVAERSALDTTRVEAGLRAVLPTLRQAAGEEQFTKAMEQMPDTFWALSGDSPPRDGRRDPRR